MINLDHAPAGLGNPLAMECGNWTTSPIPLVAGADIVLAAGHAQFTEEQRASFRQLCQATSPGNWPFIFQLAAMHSMRPLLWYHLAQEELATLIEPECWATERDAYHQQLLNQMRLTYTLREALGACHAAGIRAMPRKGPALGLRIYGKLGPRPSRDLDLLLDARVSQRRAYRVLRPYFDKWEARGIRVELAWSLIHRLSYRATFAPQSIWQRATASEFQGVPCFTLHPRDELRYLCAHHVIHHQAAEWLWLVDIAELVRRYNADAAWEWATFADECIATQTALPVLLALIQAHALLDVAIPHDMLITLSEAAQSAAEQARWAATKMPATSIHGIASLAKATRDMREMRQLLRVLLWPDLTHLREYHYWKPGQSAFRLRLRRLCQKVWH